MIGAVGLAMGWTNSWSTLPVFIHTSNETGEWTQEGLEYLAKARVVTFDKFQGTNETAQCAPTCSEEQLGCVSKCRSHPRNCSGIAAACGCVGKPAPECDEQGRMITQFKRLKAINSNVTTLAYVSSCANFPHYATAKDFARNPSLLLHDVNGSLISTHVPGFSWPEVTVIDVTQPAARKVIVDSCVAAVATGAVDGFFFDRVDDGCFQRDYGHIIDPNINAMLATARQMLVQEVQAAIGRDRLIVANHMFDMQNVTGAMNEAWSIAKGANGAKAIWQNLADCDKNGKVLEAHGPAPTNTTVAAFLIGAGDLALFGSGGWSFKGTDLKQISSRWYPEWYERKLGPPLGPAVASTDSASGNVTMIRRFASGTVASFCLNTSAGTVAWADQPPQK